LCKSCWLDECPISREALTRGLRWNGSFMQLHLLGTTGYHPNARRHTACLMLPEQGIVLDAGTGMFRVRPRLQTTELDIFLTHAHLDHIVGLTYLFGTLHEKDVKRVTVHAARDKLAAIEEHLLATAIFPVKLPCDYRAFTGPVSLGGNGALTHFPLEHPGGSLGFRLDWPGHSMAYITDTTAARDAPYIAAIRDVDLLVHECYFPDSLHELAVKTGHSSTTGVAEVARLARVRRLVLVHLNPLDESNDPIGLSTARAVFPQTELGEDEAVVEF
jgi:ribonuclease BN (tRNA processing enzyme)